ncbi:MAG: tetratricopeptide repeat protein, partial [Alphaproteobacteria bacterium]
CGDSGRRRGRSRREAAPGGSRGGQQRAAEAGKDWEDARRQHSFQGYSRFLEKHPNAEQAPEATNYLGYMYANGEGVPKDYDKALALFRKAAAGKNAEAMLNLGYHYQHGLGVPKDPNEAAAWYRKAADAGNRPAATLLRALQRETGVP